MAEPTQENALRAMRKAYDSGDIESAKRMAALAKSFMAEQVPERSSVMGQVNAGIAETMGGLVDLVNPFDNAAWEGTGLQTGSAVDALKGGMRAIEADVAETGPEGGVEGFARGVGNAAGALPAIMAGLSALSKAQGATPAVQAAARDALAAFQTRWGMIADAFAGGISGSAGELAEEAGAPEWVQQTAEMAAPMAVPVAAATGRGAYDAARTLPVGRTVDRMARDVVRGFAPQTKAGAREVAGARVRELAGGDARAAELAGMIDPQDAFGRTPAQQTGDPRLLGLEQSVSEAVPVVRENLAAGRAASAEAMEQGLRDIGGDVGDARAFFARRLRQHKTEMKAVIDDATARARQAGDDLEPRRSESAISESAAARLRNALDNELLKERELWEAIPRDATIGTGQTRAAINRSIDTVSWAQRRDIPADLRAVLDEGGPIGETTSVRELHGLYSEMRRQARSAMAGTDQNRNRARVANEVAEAILQDLGAVDANTPLGRQINEARVFSRALHETFDTGATGRILQRSLDGDTQMAGAVALQRTVGRGGAGAIDDARNIETAAPGAVQDIEQYLQGQFARNLFDASDTFTPRRARTWLRNNREILERYPQLRQTLDDAVVSQQGAADFVARGEARIGQAGQSSAARFARGQPDDAITAIFSADNPVRAAQTIRNTAAKDRTGKALEGVKASAVDFLIRQSRRGDGIDGAKLLTKAADPQTRAALSRVLTKAEMNRVNKIADAFVKMNTQAAPDGNIIDSPANQLLEYVVRIVAARQGGQMGGGTMGGSLQTANIVVDRARRFLRNMTNDKARQLLVDAVEDPKLMRELLSSIPAKPSKRTQTLLAPYLAGGASQALSEDE